MSHLDEGTLNALLDGELSTTEMRQIQAHLAGCSPCGSRLAEVKEIRAEAEQLVSTLDVPGAEAYDDQPTEPMPAVAPPRSRLAPSRTGHDEWQEPVLFLPEGDDGYGRRPWRRFLGMAAVLCVAVAAGYIGSQVRRQNEIEQSRVRNEQAARTSERAPAAVMSPEEASPRNAPSQDSPPASPARPRSEPVQPTPPPVPRATPEEQRVPLARKSRSATEGRRADTAARPPVQEELRAQNQQPDSDEEQAGLAAGAAPGRDEGLAQAEDREQESAVAQRLRDAAATADVERAQRLERERLEAQLDSAARAAALARSSGAQAGVTPTGAPAPAPVRTVEQRAQIYLRIGLDEAARQLGQPVHVIEGMFPQLMGLTQGRLSPGMDTTRPVVRVVYQDPNGRLIFLDQQRSRAGQPARPARTLYPRWTIGDVIIHLHGEPTPGALRALQQRVR